MVLRKVSLFIVTLFLVASCDGSSVETSSTSTDSGTSVNAPDGAALYSTHCATCHGLDGKLGKSGSKDLTQTTLQFLDIKKTIETGTIGGMPRFKGILKDDAEIDAVVQYVLLLKR